MYRASRALRRQVEHVVFPKLQPIKTIVSPLDSKCDSISNFQQEAFHSGTPVLITPDGDTTSAWKNGDSHLLAQHWSSSFLVATAWFNVHENDVKTNSATKSIYTIRPEAELAQHHDLVFPYELVISNVDQDVATGNWHVRKFQKYRNEDRKMVSPTEAGTANWGSRPSRTDLLQLLPHDAREGVLEALEIIRNREEPMSMKPRSTQLLDSTSTDSVVSFQQFNAPLQVLLEADRTSYQNRNREPEDAITSLYIAQAQITELPQCLRETLHPPEVVVKAGKGDIYDSNIWLGIAPTYTPLHKDPNPNYFAQIAGDKVVRLFRPNIGLGIFQRVQLELGSQGSAAIRGEEMMQGPERHALHDAVWYDAQSQDGYEVQVAAGDALFIPQGWWHSIKSVGQGVNMSANWWFR